ncbi:glycosyl transferase family protein [Sneathiella litorea]|uniref:Glycosyl transferase family protein n=1 Tax=Sneathiella litorea TaxID=2606216 RepID=A0A6L8W4B3_9PROT|nr:glycosyl transferase family protein [Sneathiella litorea]MZR29931.1 glycosyl transferase family protein [Sneathiella litorea]
MTQDHPFAQYVRILGKGPKMWRDMTFDEARAAMNMVFSGEVEPLQLGAFLLLLRRKGETGEELAGMVAAARDHFLEKDITANVDFDWPSYADRHRQQPWFILSAILLADQGYKVLMHGIEGYVAGYAATRPGLAVFGIPQADSLSGAAALFGETNLVYLGLEKFCPSLQTLFELRPLLGVRTAVNTFGRDLNPFAAPRQLQGVFHPPYKALHLETVKALHQPHSLIFKGGGGEVQRNPMKPALVDALIDGEVTELEWPAMTEENVYKWREEDLAPAQLLRMWQGKLDLKMPLLAIIGTLAFALKSAVPTLKISEAESRARDIWDSRDKNRFG